MSFDFERRDFLRYAMVGGIAVPMTFASGLWTSAQAGTFNFPKDPTNPTDFEKEHMPKITLPPVVEDGSQAPIEISMDHPMEPDHYIRQIQIVGFNDPVQTKGNFYLSHLNGQAFIGTQIRLNGGESSVWVIAECNQHGRWAASKDTQVAAGGC